MANTMTFVKIENRAGKQILPVKGRAVSDLELPKECKFYFFDSEYYIGSDGNLQLVGRSYNKSAIFYKVKEYYPNPDHFRVYFMRCHGWSEEEIWNHNSEKVKMSAFYNYNEKFPNGIVILDQVITDPGKNGIILSAEETITEYRMPTPEELRAYGR